VTNSGPVFTRPDGSMLDSGSVLEAGV
jgi:hypothetical protein